MSLIRPPLFGRALKVVTASQSFGYTTNPDSLPLEINADKMLAWQIHSYGGLEDLRLSTARKPSISSPRDVIVQVSSASVNPIDVAMTSGYGSVMLNTLRAASTYSVRPSIEFPLSLGRDFCGVVVAKGMDTGRLALGDEVWGTVPPHQQGCHAQNVAVDRALVHAKPVALNDVEAGSMLYAAVTAWSALKLAGGLALGAARRRRVLVLGGSGGVGLMAVQLLRAWGVQVVATCQADAIPLLESLNVDCVIDYTQPDSEGAIRDQGKYDIILDCAGLGTEAAPRYVDSLKDWNCSKFVTLKSPMLRNVDDYGLVGGMFKNAVDLVVPNVRTLGSGHGSTVRWAFYTPLPAAVKEISRFVQEGKICPVVEKVYPFECLPEAYAHVGRGHLRGKVVVAFERYHSVDEYKS